MWKIKKKTLEIGNWNIVFAYAQWDIAIHTLYLQTGFILEKSHCLDTGPVRYKSAILREVVIASQLTEF